MRRLVDPPAVVGDADARQHQRDGVPLGGEWGAGRGAVAARVGDERRELLRELPEDLLQALRREPEVVVGQHRVVGPGEAVEALRVRARELDVAAQGRSEGGEVAGLPRRLPDRLALRGGALDLGRQVAGHAPGAVEVAAGDPHDVGVDALEPVALELVQPRADLVGGRARVREPLQRRELLAAAGASGGRHHRALIPGGQAAERREVAQLRHPLPQGVQTHADRDPTESGSGVA